MKRWMERERDGSGLMFAGLTLALQRGHTNSCSSIRSWTWVLQPMIWQQQDKMTASWMACFPE